MNALPTEQLPAPVTRLLSNISQTETNGAFGTVLLALSASKTNGLGLVLGAGDGLNLSWIISGLPRDSKLLATCEDTAQLDCMRRSLDTDLRVAFHQQETTQFIDDIKHHRFDLIYVGSAIDQASSDLLQTMLMPGGFIVTNPEVNPALVTISEETASLLPLPAPLDKDGLKLYVKGERPLKRRGGRKAKHDRPSLRSL